MKKEESKQRCKTNFTEVLEQAIQSPNGFLVACLLQTHILSHTQNIMHLFAKIRLSPEETSHCRALLKDWNCVAIASNYLHCIDSFLLFWEINDIDNKQMTLLNYAVANKYEESIYALLQRGAQLQTKHSCYNNVASICMFARETPSKKCKRIRNEVVSIQDIIEYQRFFDVESALLTENKQHCLQVLASHSDTQGNFLFDCNKLTIANTSLLSMIMHIEVLQRFLQNGFTIVISDMHRAVNYIPFEITNYLLHYCLVSCKEIVDACKDTFMRMRILEIGDQLVKKQQKEVDNSLPKIPTDVCHIIVAYI
jgi:hypothetical protein